MSPLDKALKSWLQSNICLKSKSHLPNSLQVVMFSTCHRKFNSYTRCLGKIMHDCIWPPSSPGQIVLQFAIEQRVLPCREENYDAEIQKIWFLAILHTFDTFTTRCSLTMSYVTIWQYGSYRKATNLQSSTPTSNQNDKHVGVYESANTGFKVWRIMDHDDLPLEDVVLLLVGTVGTAFNNSASAKESKRLDCSTDWWFWTNTDKPCQCLFLCIIEMVPDWFLILVTVFNWFVRDPVRCFMKYALLLLPQAKQGRKTPRMPLSKCPCLQHKPSNTHLPTSLLPQISV